LFENHLHRLREKTNHVFLWLLPLQWTFAVGYAWYSATLSTASKVEEVSRDKLWLAIGLGGILALLPAVLIAKASRRPTTRMVLTVAQLLFSILLMHLMDGRIEAHFHVFGSLALLTGFFDSWVFLPAIGIVLVDHLLHGLLWPDFAHPDLIHALEHVAWVCFEVLFLLLIIRQGRQQLCETARLQATLTQERDLLEKRVEARTKERCQSEAEARAVFDSSLDAIIIVDERGTVLQFNPEAAKMFGICAEEAVGQPVSEIVIPLQMRDHHETVWQRDFTKGESRILDQRNRVTACRRDGQEFPAELAVLRIVTGGLVRFVACIRDVTQEIERERELEEAVRESQDGQAFLDQVLNHIPACVFWKDRESRYLGCNAAFATAAGLESPGEVIGKTDFDLPWSREQSEGFRANDKAVIRSGTPQLQVEEEPLTASGETNTVLTCKVPLIDATGETVGVLGIYSDITERKQLELRVAQSSKMQSLGQLAAGIAHEINTPMQCVVGNVEFLKNCYERLFEIVHVCLQMVDPPSLAWEERRTYIEDFIESKRFNYIMEQVPQAMDEADQSVKRVIEIVQAMKAMSHPGTRNRVGLDINSLLHSAATISRNRWKYCAELVEEFDSLPEIQAMPADLSQVFLNLIVNAADAIAEKFTSETTIQGRITVRTRLLGKFVCVEVEDNGVGIPESIRHKVFDPFFTTKEVGKGTGQGLAIVYDVIANRHQGSIEVTSQLGEGTKFILLLPVEHKSEVKSEAVADLLEEMRKLEECLA
jgi:PAS domain S-box-containing protein